MAGIAFSAGQSMIRPGVYNRYVQVASPLYAGASDGIVGCAFSAQWGPLGEVIEITSLKQAIGVFGGDGGIFRQIFTGGASTVYAVRAGLGGTAAVCTLMDAAGAAAVEVSARYVGMSLPLRTTVCVTLYCARTARSWSVLCLLLAATKRRRSSKRARVRSM